VIAALRSCGLWDDCNRRQGRIVRRETRPAIDAPPNRADAKRTMTALRSWEASSSVPGTLAETYLRSRALHHPTSDRIRFHPGLKHPSGGIWPTMVGLPQDAREVIVLADGDDPGEAAARDCAHRWKREGRSVRIARPPRGCDFNDLLLGHAPHIGEGAA
jgi:hypothetical protein